MNPLKTIFLCFYTVLLFSSSIPNIAIANKPCQSSANFDQMDKDFYSFLQQKQLHQEGNITVLPFFDNHAGTPSPVLAEGLPFLIFDTFSTTNNNFIHPYTTQNNLNDMGISGEALTEKSVFQQIAAKQKSQYVIGGSLQQTGNSGIRLFLSIYHKDKNDFIVRNLTFAANLNDKILYDIVNHIDTTLRSHKIKIEKLDKIYVPNLEHFKYYITGVQLAQKYDTVSLNRAIGWLEKSAQGSLYQYKDAGLVLARAYFMLAMQEKLSAKSFTLSFNKGKETLNKIQITTENLNNFKEKITVRYLASQRLLAEGIIALKNGQKEVAFLKAYDGIKLAPEDGLLQNLYSQTYSKENAKTGVFINNAVCF